MELSGILGILILIADIYAIVKVVQSRAKTGLKVIWIIVVLLLPLIGLIVWFFAGPGSPKR